MKTRNTRALLWLCTASLLGLAVAVVCLHVLFPARAQTIAPDGYQALPVEQVQNTPASFAVDPASLQRVASKDIRQRLFDPPVEPPKPPQPKPLPQIELISTILGDNGQHRAWVRDGQTIRKVMVGDTLGTADNPATVESIEKEKLILQHDSKQIEVTQATNGGRR